MPWCTKDAVDFLDRFTFRFFSRQRCHHRVNLIAILSIFAILVRPYLVQQSRSPELIRLRHVLDAKQITDRRTHTNSMLANNEDNDFGSSGSCTEATSGTCVLTDVYRLLSILHQINLS